MLLLVSCGSTPGSPTTTKQSEQTRAIDSARRLPPLETMKSRGPRVGTGPVRIALLVPLSGRFAGLGKALLDAAQLALFDIGNERLLLLPFDTAGTSQGTVDAMRAAVAGRVHIVLGPLFASGIRAAGPIARAAGVPVIGFSTDRSVAGNGIYIMGFTVEQQISRIVDHAIAQGRYRHAALIPDSEYGRHVLSAYRIALARRGGELVQVEQYQEREDALFEPVKRIANYEARSQALREEREALADFGEDDELAQELLRALARKETLGDLTYSAILLPAGGNIIRALAPLLPYYEIDPKQIMFLGTGLWDDPDLRLEPALAGARFAGVRPRDVELFAAHYKSAYGTTPARLASLAYDAVALTAALLRYDNVQPFAQQTLLNNRGFSGIDGVFRFQPNGTAERSLAIIEIQSDGLHEIEPALQSFAVMGTTPTLVRKAAPETGTGGRLNDQGLTELP